MWGFLSAIFFSRLSRGVPSSHTSNQLIPVLPASPSVPLFPLSWCCYHRRDYPHLTSCLWAFVSCSRAPTLTNPAELRIYGAFINSMRDFIQEATFTLIHTIKIYSRKDFYIIYVPKSSTLYFAMQLLFKDIMLFNLRSITYKITQLIRADFCTMRRDVNHLPGVQIYLQNKLYCFTTRKLDIQRPPWYNDHQEISYRGILERNEGISPEECLRFTDDRGKVPQIRSESQEARDKTFLDVCETSTMIFSNQPGDDLRKLIAGGKCLR